MTSNQNPRHAFPEIRDVTPYSVPGQLLSASGWFYLADVFRLLDDPDTGKYKLAFKLIERMEARGEDAFATMGKKKFGGRIAVLMERFAPWYEHNPLMRAVRVDPEQTFPEFLSLEDGVFRRSEVCQYVSDFLPDTYSGLKRHADRREDCRMGMGVFKYETTYLVELPQFERWLREQIL
jgi:hypothetical protein